LRSLVDLSALKDETFLRKLFDQHDEKLIEEVLEQIEIEIKYDGYVERQEGEIRKFEKFEEISIPLDYNYHAINSLSAEGKEKLSKIKPESVGQASRISGVTPADVSILLVHLRR
jgi:tRNA uridine 5-carboxymethylaminomethyl modification enzyme